MSDISLCGGAKQCSNALKKLHILNIKGDSDTWHCRNLLLSGFCSLADSSFLYFCLKLAQSSV